MSGRTRFLKIKIMEDGDSTQLAKGVLLSVGHDGEFTINIDGAMVKLGSMVTNIDDVTEILLPIITVAAVNYRIMKDIKVSVAKDEIYMAEGLSLTINEDGTFAAMVDDEFLWNPELSGKLASDLTPDNLNYIAQRAIAFRKPPLEKKLGIFRA